jgi:hypothetical protein
VGFTLPRTIYRLVFTDPDFEGLEIRVYAGSMEDRLRAAYELDWGPDDSAEERTRKQNDLFALFVEHIVDWNLEDKDKNPVPVPTTVKELRKVGEPAQVGAIVGAWRGGRMEVPAPLEQPSPGIELSEIPMTVLPSTPEPASSLAS